MSTKCMPIPFKASTKKEDMKKNERICLDLLAIVVVVSLSYAVPKQLLSPSH
jgi:hypothetical protein